MPYGEYIPSKTIIGDCMGMEVATEVPDMYSGLLWAIIYDPNGKEIKIAETYFEELAISHGKDNTIYTDLIRSVIHNYCRNYVKPFCTDPIYHSCQSGFGQEYRDGLIDFTTVQPIRAPSTLFGINDELYTIKWEYSPGSDE